MSNDDYQIQLLSCIDDIDQKKWDSLVLDNNPFVKYHFFKALEVGKCVNGHTGWHPQYFVLSQGDRYISAFFAYLKLDSYGEFIFDWEWARAFEQYQVPYFPKLTTAIAYSPITAPKILGNLSLFEDLLLPRVMKFYQTNEFSSFHILFSDELEKPIFEKQDFKERDSFQYHWENKGFKTFDDFLQSLKKNRRKSIKRERKAVSHLHYKKLSGDQVTTRDLEIFYECYLGTIDKKLSQAYLSLDFFKALFENMPENTILLQALDPLDQTVLGNALYLKSDKRLYGRYWGSTAHVEFLHFELCLYRGLEIAIAEGLEVFEAGAQGEHKRMRGFTPLITKSLHHIKHPEFSVAINNFIEQERKGISGLFSEFETVSPIKKV